MNKALEWGRTTGISPKAIEGILRGRRKLGVEFERVDAILCALDSPEHWYHELSHWYYPPGAEHEPEYELWFRQPAAFDLAYRFLQGGDQSLVFA